MTDPDKKVDKMNKKRRNLYQSSQHPRHFTNEGEEFSTAHPNNIDSDMKPIKESENLKK